MNRSLPARYGVLFWSLTVLLSSLPGCALFGGLRVDPVATSYQTPSNVAVYMTVSEGDKPVSGLTEKNFKVFEDGQELSPAQTQQTLLPRDVAAVHRAVLLLDLSGAITEGDLRERIARAAARFVTTVRRSQPVTVYAFDGGGSIRLIGDFPAGDQELETLEGVTSFTPADVSSNLNAAVVKALAELDTRLMPRAKPLRIGTLVVFVRGPDLAGRVSEEAMLEAVDDSPHHVFAIGLEDSPYRPSSIGKSDVFMAPSISVLDGAFDQAARRTDDTFHQYYLLSYCSPARAGTRQLRIEVEKTDAEGNAVSGRLSTDFNADGFSSGCNPRSAPRFIVRAEPEDTGDEEEEEVEEAPKKPVKTRPAAPPRQPAGDGEEETIVPPPDKPGYAQ